jgi:hypothetical protein
MAADNKGSRRLPWRATLRYAKSKPFSFTLRVTLRVTQSVEEVYTDFFEIYMLA